MAPTPATSERRARQLGGELDDAELVFRALEGDGWAERVLYQRYSPGLGQMAARMLGNRADAEDALQDAWITVLTELDKLRDPGAFKGWVRQITVRAVHRRYRRRALRRRLGMDRGIDFSLASTAAPGASAEVLAELEAVDRALARLKLEVRSAWMLRVVEGYRLEEVAVACSCSLATAKRRIREGRLVVEKEMGR